MPSASTTRPVVSGVDFVGISVTDLKRAMAFYDDVLGLERTVLREPFNAEYQVGNVTVCLLDGAKMGMPAPANQTHLSLHADDFDAAVATLTERGVAFTREHIDTGVCHMAFFEDPDGNALMIHHRYAPKEH